MSEAEPETAEAAPPSSSKAGGGSKLTMLLMVVNLAATGFVGFQVLGVKGAVHAAAAPVVEKPATPGSGPTAQFEPFVVNLDEPGSSRYLKVTFEAEAASESSLNELNAAKRAVRDDILRYLSSLHVADTLGEAAKAKIQSDLLARLDKILGHPGAVTHMYFTEFVVQ